MGRIQRTSSAGGLEPNLVAVGEQVDAVLRVVDDNIEFGEPQDPNDPTSTTLAGTMGAAGHHNGTLSNIAGSWVEIALPNTGLSDLTCTHNLYLDTPAYVLPVTGQPNCRWLHFGTQHDGTGSDATTRIGVDVTWMGGDTLSVNAIELRFNLRVEGLRPTIGAGNPVLVTLFFTKATRGE